MWNASLFPLRVRASSDNQADEAGIALVSCHAQQLRRLPFRPPSYLSPSVPTSRSTIQVVASRCRKASLPEKVDSFFSGAGCEVTVAQCLSWRLCLVRCLLSVRCNAAAVQKSRRERPFPRNCVARIHARPVRVCGEAQMRACRACRRASANRPTSALVTERHVTSRKGTGWPRKGFFRCVYPPVEVDVVRIAVEGVGTARVLERSLPFCQILSVGSASAVECTIEKSCDPCMWEGISVRLAGSDE